MTEAAREMRDGDVGSVVVTDNGKVAGIITDRDIAIRVMREQDVRRLVVAQGGRPAGIVSLGDLSIERDTDSVLADIASESANN